MAPLRELRCSEKACAVSVSPRWNAGNSARIFSSRALLMEFLRTADVCSLVSGEYQFAAKFIHQRILACWSAIISRQRLRDSVAVDYFQRKLHREAGQFCDQVWAD